MSKKKKKKKIKASKQRAKNLTHLRKQLIHLRENTRKILENKDLYFDERMNQNEIEQYYLNVRPNGDFTPMRIKDWSDLISKTHKNQIPYSLSKDLYLYTWVDLYPDGSVQSIYSGREKDPAKLIIQDYEIIQLRYDEYNQYLKLFNESEFESLKELKRIEWRYRLNTEHIVPQSWFGGNEPMKGDLHHLFICDPDCNILRSNFPYYDFNFYQPESESEPIRNQCGVVSNGKFEPEFGKGIAARAMLYFLLRYPIAIKKSFEKGIDIPLLAQWHKDNHVTLYENICLEL